MRIFLSKSFSYDIYSLLRVERHYNIVGNFLYLFFNNKHNRSIYKKEKEYYSSLEECNFTKAEQCIKEIEYLGLIDSTRIAGMEVKLRLGKIRKENK